jgi:hypothetical protein
MHFIPIQPYHSIPPNFSSEIVESCSTPPNSPSHPYKLNPNERKLDPSSFDLRFYIQPLDSISPQKESHDDTSKTLPFDTPQHFSSIFTSLEASFSMIHGMQEVSLSHTCDPVLNSATSSQEEKPFLNFTRLVGNNASLPMLSVFTPDLSSIPQHQLSLEYLYQPSSFSPLNTIKYSALYMSPPLQPLSLEDNKPHAAPTPKTVCNYPDSQVLLGHEFPLSENDPHPDQPGYQSLLPEAKPIPAQLKSRAELLLGLTCLSKDLELIPKTEMEKKDILVRNFFATNDLRAFYGQNCPLCSCQEKNSFTIFDSISYEQHFRLEHAHFLSYDCTVCNRDYKSRKGLLQHIKSSRAHQRNMADRAKINASSMRLHLSIHFPC